MNTGAALAPFVCLSSPRVSGIVRACQPAYSPALPGRSGHTLPTLRSKREFFARHTCRCDLPCRSEGPIAVVSSGRRPEADTPASIAASEPLSPSLLKKAPEAFTPRASHCPGPPGTVPPVGLIASVSTIRNAAAGRLIHGLSTGVPRLNTMVDAIVFGFWVTMTSSEIPVIVLTPLPVSASAVQV